MSGEHRPRVPVSQEREPESAELPRPPFSSSRKGRTLQIVKVAREILEKEGYESLTMRRLADELGIRAPSLYKHFCSKHELEVALLEDAFVEIGDLTHAALHDAARPGLEALLHTYREYCLAHGNLYRLATSGPLPRDELSPGLEEWAGNPWYVVTGDPSLAQALWSFAHGMVTLELDDRYPPGSDIEATWRAGARAFSKLGLRAAPGTWSRPTARRGPGR